MAAGPYTRTVYTSGQTLNLRTVEMLIATERRCGFTLVITQGSYNPDTEQSAGTHDGGGALDVRAKDLTGSQRDKVVLELRRVGFAAWLRTPSQGDWPYHIHAIAVGDHEMSSQAAWQVSEYKAGRNGLASKGPDDGPRQFVGTVYRQELDVSFYGPEKWDDADFDRFFDNAGWGRNIDNLVDGGVSDAKKILSYIHKNVVDGEDAAKSADTHAVDAQIAANAAQTAAGAAKSAAEAAQTAALDAKKAAEDTLAAVTPPPQ